MNRRRGYILIEVMFALALIGIVMNMAVRLTAGLLGTATQLSEVDRAEATIDQATRLLRRDAEASARITPGVNAVTLDAASWSVDGAALVRTQGGQARRFAALPSPQIEATARGVTLHLGEAAWSFRPLLSGGPQ